MDFWKNKVAVVTGCSAGIGRAIVLELCKNGIIVFGLARRLDRLEQLKKEINELYPESKFFFSQCDVMDEAQIIDAFQSVLNQFNGVDILINNAGISTCKSILEEESNETFERIVKTNFVAVVSCTKKAYKSMVDRKAEGYIINISSALGHSIPCFGQNKPMFNVYPSTKYGLTALNTVLRQELNYYGNSKIRISNISPGFVKTDILETSNINAECKTDHIKMLLPDDVAQAVAYVLSTPSRVQVQELIIKPNGELF